MIVGIEIGNRAGTDQPADEIRNVRIGEAVGRIARSDGRRAKDVALADTAILREPGEVAAGYDAVDRVSHLRGRRRGWRIARPGAAPEDEVDAHELNEGPAMIGEIDCNGSLRANGSEFIER